jgi:hypothetical protein
VREKEMLDKTQSRNEALAKKNKVLSTKLLDGKTQSRKGTPLPAATGYHTPPFFVLPAPQRSLRASYSHECPNHFAFCTCLLTADY